ncbi:hypothetical protein GGR52DRAFT_428207 [Hypoxylon sp. FL1284]|nr:hypothetical protein GGR52DRAFT_428207 [Hypoxylon sp. FL1284]
MQLLSFLKTAVLASLAVTSIAVPVPVNTGDVSIDSRELIDKRTPPVPTVEQCKEQLNVAPNTSMFYSGPGSYAAKALKAINDSNGRPYLEGYKLLSRMWKDSKFPDQWQDDAAASKEFFDNASQAMAELTSGTAYVMLPQDEGTNWYSGSVWDRKEWPNIPEDVRVIRINPNNLDTQVVPRG